MSANQRPGQPSWILILWSGPHKEHLCQVWNIDSCSRSWEEVKNVSANQRLGWPSWILDPLKSNNTWLGTHNGHCAMVLLRWANNWLLLKKKSIVVYV